MSKLNLSARLLKEVISNSPSDQLIQFLVKSAKSDPHLLFQLLTRFNDHTSASEEELYNYLFYKPITLFRSSSNKLSSSKQKHLANLYGEMLNQSADALAIDHFIKSAHILIAGLTYIRHLIHKEEKLISEINQLYIDYHKGLYDLSNEILPQELNRLLIDFLEEEIFKPNYFASDIDYNLYNILIKIYERRGETEKSKQLIINWLENYNYQNGHSKNCLFYNFINNCNLNQDEISFSVEHFSAENWVFIFNQLQSNEKLEKSVLLLKRIPFIKMYSIGSHTKLYILMLNILIESKNWKEAIKLNKDITPFKTPTSVYLKNKTIASIPLQEMIETACKHCDFSTHEELELLKIYNNIKHKNKIAINHPNILKSMEICADLPTNDRKESVQFIAEKINQQLDLLFGEKAQRYLDEINIKIQQFSLQDVLVELENIFHKKEKISGNSPTIKLK